MYILYTHKTLQTKAQMQPHMHMHLFVKLCRHTANRWTSKKVKMSIS